jgi:drug/metabolite transporter (DMT)-like permease
LVREWIGVGAAVLSSAIGGTAIGATRYLAGTFDPLALGSFRFGIGFLFLLPLALISRPHWPARRDWCAIAALGLLFFFVFPILFNAALSHTTAARGALALSTLPLLTMAVAAALGREHLTLRKTIGVTVAMAGVAIALVSGLQAMPPDAWQGDLLMVAAAFCMALYSIWCRDVMNRTGAVAFVTIAMGVGAAALVAVAVARGSFAPVARLSPVLWIALLYLGAVGSALTFYLWSLALERTTPTRVAISVTVNPISAAIVGLVMLGEPLPWTIPVAIATVFAGIVTAMVRTATDDVSKDREENW